MKSLMKYDLNVIVQHPPTTKHISDLHRPIPMNQISPHVKLNIK